MPPSQSHHHHPQQCDGLESSPPFAFAQGASALVTRGRPRCLASSAAGAAAAASSSSAPNAKVGGRPRSQSNAPGASTSHGTGASDIAAALPRNEWQDRVAALLDTAAQDLHLLSPSVSPSPALGAYRDDDAGTARSYSGSYRDGGMAGDGADGETMVTANTRAAGYAI